MKVMPFPFRSSRSECAELGDIRALQHRGLFEFTRDDCADVGWQAFPCGAVAENPVTVPHVRREADVLLHFIELGGGDDRQRIFLALHHAGLQRRIQLVEIDRRRARRRAP